MIRSILVPTDFSANAEAAAEYACGLAVALGASMTLLHVFSAPIIATPDATFAPTDEELTALAEAARDKLYALARRLARPGLRLVPQTREGDAAKVILDASADADLIVMGTHGRGPVLRLLLGSVAEHVVRGARCPVLTLTESATQPSLSQGAAT